MWEITYYSAGVRTCLVTTFTSSLYPSWRYSALEHRVNKTCALSEQLAGLLGSFLGGVAFKVV